VVSSAPCTTSATGSAFLAVFSLFQSGTGAGTTCTDNFGNTYNLIGTTPGTGSNTIYAFLCNRGSGGASHVATINPTGFPLPGTAELIEITGASATPLDQINAPALIGTGSSPVTTTLANELAISVGQINLGGGVTIVPNGGFTTVNNSPTDDYGSAFHVATATGTYDPLWSGSGGAGIGSITVSLFSPSAAPSGGPVPTQLFIMP
jgi:hypothetical protein